MERGSLSGVVDLLTHCAALPYLNIHGLLSFIPVTKYLTRVNVREKQFILAHNLTVHYGSQSMEADSFMATRAYGLDLVKQREEMGHEAIRLP